MRWRWLVLVGALGCGRKTTAPPRVDPPLAPPAPKVIVERETERRESSGLVLVRIDGATRAFLADEDDAAILELDPARGEVVHATTFESRPRDLLVGADGALFATFPDANRVVRFTRAADGGLREEASAAGLREPLAMATDDHVLYVSAGAGHALVALDPALRETGRWELRREPRGVLVDGERVLVGHASDSALSVVRPAEREVRRVELGIGSECDSFTGCTPPRLARHAHALVRTAAGIAVPSVQVQPHPARDDGMTLLPPPPGSVDTPATSRSAIVGYGIGARSARPPMFASVVVLGHDDKPVPHGVTSCLEPRAATGLGDRVVVACRGSARVAIHGLEPRQGSSLAAPSEVVVGAGPAAVAVDRTEKTLYVWSAFARELGRVDVREAVLEPKPMRKTAAPPLGWVLDATHPIPRAVTRDEKWLRGRTLFVSNGDARISKDGRACASCHIDGRDDGLTWDTPAGPRRTRLLAGQLEHPPYGWRGEHAKLEAHVEVTFRQLGGPGLPRADLEALLTYVRALAAPPAGPDPDARGRALFGSAECADCHDGTGDRAVHDVGTGGAFLSPTLAGVGARRQLMHDGRYVSLEELLMRSPRMGTAASLPAGDRAALVRYLETL